MSKSLSKLLDNDNHALREKMKRVLKEPIFKPLYHLSLEQERALAYQRLDTFLSAGLVSVRDFKTDPRRIFAAHEVLGLCDGSATTKMTVQMNLFGGTLLRFGDKPEFQTIIDGISQFTEVGCFGLTELGFGNNAVEMQTTATFDENSDEFIIDSPTTLSQKYWITNGYCHAHWAIVFAQLMIKGESYGVHGFLVPIRDKQLNPLPGVTVQNMGYKIGLNGVDNARLWFNQVRVPRENLLDAFSKVSADGEFSSQIKGKRGRFIKMADQLLSGRLCIASMTLASCKSIMTTTIRYSQTRNGVSADSRSSTPLLDYQLQQNALIPLLVDTVALNIGLNAVKNEYAEKQTQDDGTQLTSSELIKQCCVIKTMIGWHTEEAASIGRERCGGQGFLACNRFGEVIAGAHAAITAEGDNSVLMQKVAKECLSKLNFKKVLNQKFTALLPAFIQRLFVGKAPGKLIRMRLSRNLADLALIMNQAKQQHGKVGVFDTWMKQQSDLVQDTAWSYGEDLVLNACYQALKQAQDPLLLQLVNCYELSLVYRHRAWYFERGLLSRRQYRKLEKQYRQCCGQVALQVDEVLAAFNIPEHCLTAPIAGNWEDYNIQSQDNQGEVESHHVFFQSTDQATTSRAVLS